MKKLNQLGFTIPELLTVIMIMGVVITGIASLFVSAQSTQQRTLLLESATRAAQLQVESLRNYNYGSLVSGEDIDFTDRLPETLPNNKVGTVTVSEPKPGLRRIDVLITYSSQGKPERVELSSMIGILGITQ